MLGLDGSIIVVTGAGGGIGQAICGALSEAGAEVVATDLRENAHCAAALRLAHDVASADSWGKLTAELSDRYGRLDALVNNAGMPFTQRFEDLTVEEWRQVMSVNLDAVLLGLQACLPLLRKGGETRPGGASVVNIASTAGLRGVAFGSAYAASKSALVLLSRSAAKEFAMLGYPVRVNNVLPGAVETEMTEQILERHAVLGLQRSSASLRDAWLAKTPLRRMAKPSEIAGAIRFLCSVDASFMTGADLVVDGGATA